MQETIENAIDLTQVGNRQYVVLARGALDDRLARVLRDVVFPLAGEPGARIVVDLTLTEMISPAAAGTLTAAAHTSRKGGGQVVVVSGNPDVRRLFEATSLAASA